MRVTVQNKLTERLTVSGLGLVPPQTRKTFENIRVKTIENYGAVWDRLVSQNAIAYTVAESSSVADAVAPATQQDVSEKIDTELAEGGSIYEQIQTALEAGASLTEENLRTLLGDLAGTLYFNYQRAGD